MKKNILTNSTFAISFLSLYANQAHAMGLMDLVKSGLQLQLTHASASEYGAITLPRETSQSDSEYGEQSPPSTTVPFTDYSSSPSSDYPTIRKVRKVIHREATDGLSNSKRLKGIVDKLAQLQPKAQNRAYMELIGVRNQKELKVLAQQGALSAENIKTLSTHAELNDYEASILAEKIYQELQKTGKK